MLKKQRKLRKNRIRSKISGTAKKPRLSVFRSNKLVYAQLIDDQKSITIAQAKDSDPKKVGTEIAKLAKKEKISEIVFDRSGYKYHGKVKALAEATREAGLKF